MTTLTTAWKADKEIRPPEDLVSAVFNSGYSGVILESSPLAILRSLLSRLEEELEAEIGPSEKLGDWLAFMKRNPSAGWTRSNWGLIMGGQFYSELPQVTNTAKAFALLLQWLHRRESVMLGRKS